MLTEQEGLRIKAIDAQIKQLSEEKSDIMARAALKELPTGTHSVGRVDVVVSPNRRFDSELAMEKYPLGEDGTNLNLYDASISSKKAKANLTPAEYEALQKVYPNKIEVRINE